MGHDYVLNTGQMRNAVAIQPHYIPFVSTRLHDDIIHQAAMREVALTKRNQIVRDQPSRRPAALAVPAHPSHAGASTPAHLTPQGESLHAPFTPLTSGFLATSHAQPDDTCGGGPSYTPTTFRPTVHNGAHRAALLSSYNIQQCT